jgi:hypothetical protein
VQLAIRAQLMLQVTKLWPSLNKKQLDATWPAWIAAMKLLLGQLPRAVVARRRYYQQSRRPRRGRQSHHR